MAQSLATAIESVLHTPAARRGVWGIKVLDPSNGRVLFESNPDVPMTPASNTKLFSTALALVRLGPDHRFRTQVLADGTVDSDGRLHGNLVLAGGGDPTISARPIPYTKDPVEGDPFPALRTLAAQVAASGIRVVEGNLIGDDTLYPWVPYPGGWAVADSTWEYGAPVSALTLHDNTVQLSIRASKVEPFAAIELMPPVEFFTIQNRVQVGVGLPRKARIERLPGSRVLLVHGTLPPGAAATSYIALDDPALYTAQVFRSLLSEAGVTVRGNSIARHRESGVHYVPPAGRTVAERLSPPLVETLRIVNKVSQNLHAELILRETTRRQRGDSSPELAGEEMDAFLKEVGIAEEEYDLGDGSGLSRRNLVTPAAVVKLLAWLHHSPYRDEFWSLLPVAGEDGTLERRFRGLGEVSAIRAKTGSVAHVNALSGYAGLDPSKRLVFSILVNQTTAPASEIRALIDKIGKAILQAVAQ